MEFRGMLYPLYIPDCVTISYIYIYILYDRKIIPRPLASIFRFAQQTVEFASICVRWIEEACIYIYVCVRIFFVFDTNEKRFSRYFVGFAYFYFPALQQLHYTR